MKSTRAGYWVFLVGVAIALAGCATSRPASTKAPSTTKSERSARPADGTDATTTPSRKAVSGAKNDNISRETQRAFSRAVDDVAAGRYTEAEPTLVRLTSSEPELSGPHANLGLVYLKTQRIEDARKELERAVSLNPNNPALLNYLGIAERSAGNFDKARDAYNKALELDPNFAPAHANLGILLDLYLGDPSAALPHYQTYADLTAGKDRDAAVWIAEIQKRVKTTDAAPPASR
jgi:Flp pilus assembly protein TadD